MPETGFTGPVSELNRTTGSYPGSVRTRFSERKPQSHAYAPLAPVLHYNPGQDDLVGGNFWDMRATGRRLANPAAEQAQGPPTNPVEMGLPDIARAVYRASQRPYRSLFETVWGQQAFAIAWPNDVEQVWPDRDRLPPTILSRSILNALDRGRAAATFDQIAQSIAGYEASAEITTFTSKFDAVLASKVKLSSQEQVGYDLFRGKAQCNACHRDGWRGPAVHRFHRQQYRNSCQSPVALLCRAATGCAGLCRQSGRIVIRGRWRWQFPHQGSPSVRQVLIPVHQVLLPLM
jgi:cytochrome c peroxidase